MIEQYSRGRLAKSQDKLVPISGVAKVLAERFGDTYMAGLWKSYFIGGLCWRVPKMRRTTQEWIPSGLFARRWEISRRLEGNGAPSWSWASVDGETEAGPFQSEESEDRVQFVLESGPSGYATCASSLIDPRSVTIVPTTETNIFGEVDTECTQLQLHGTTYPRIYIRGVANIKLPLSRRDAASMVDHCRRVPGSTDPSLRKTWILDTQEFQCRNCAWKYDLHDLVAKAVEDLGTCVKVYAHLSQLLLSEEGA